MRLLFVISAYPPAKKAGMEGNCQAMAQALARSGHSVAVLTRWDPTMPRISEEQGVRVYRVVSPVAVGPAWGLTYMAGLRRWAIRLRKDWDAAVCYGLGLNSVAVESACRKLGKPWVNRIATAGGRGDIAALRGLRFGERLLRRALASTGHLALSGDVERDLLREGIDAAQIRRYPPLVDLQRFSPGGGHESLRPLVYIGRFAPKKNVPLLIRAFISAWKVFPSARLRLVGGGDTENEVRRVVAECEAREAIEVVPWCETPELEYRGALASVSASESEGLSNALLEAMACGLPCIMTDVSGVREVLANVAVSGGRPAAGSYLLAPRGLIVAPGDEGALAAAMLALLRDGELAQQLGAAARAYAEENFGEDNAVRSLVGSLTSLCGRCAT